MIVEWHVAGPRSKEAEGREGKRRLGDEPEIGRSRVKIGGSGGRPRKQEASSQAQESTWLRVRLLPSGSTQAFPVGHGNANVEAWKRGSH